MEYTPLALILLLSYVLYQTLIPWRRVTAIWLLLMPIIIALIYQSNIHILIILAVTLVLLTSHARILIQRYGRERERKLLIRTWKRLSISVVAFVVLNELSNKIGADKLSTVFIIIILIISVRALVVSIYRSYKYSYIAANNTQKSPTVTLAIPARNETHALTDSLRAAVAIDYPKLEILVLDDCSQDSTPQIIRSFAHDGIRFIQGTSPSSSWLGKNYAYDKLLTEASGEIVIFCGVDAHLSSNSVQQIVNTFCSQSINVLSIMPTRRNFDILPSIFRSIRYYWEIAFSIWPNMNSCWIVNRKWLIDKGGFKLYKHHILPEREIARSARAEDSYKFAISNKELGISTRKKLNSELETMTRTIYPRLHRELLWIFISTTLGLLAVITLLSSIFVLWGDSIMLLQISGIYLWFSFIVSEYILQPKFWFITSLFAPINWLSTSILGVISLVKYEFGSVDWKGRNVCLPVLYQNNNAIDDASASQARSRSSDKR